MPAIAVNTLPIEWYVRVTIYSSLVLWPFIGLSFAFVFPPGPIELVVIATLGAAQCGLSVWVGHRAINLLLARMQGGGSADGWLWRSVPELSWLAVTAANVVVIAMWGLRNDAWPGLLLSALIVSSIAATAPALSLRQSVYTYAATAVLVLVCMLGNGPALQNVFMAVWYFFGALAFLSAVWLSVWILRVVKELEYSRDAAGRLAVAEDRLRISRDLHDVFGRTLATISVKSTLAAELSRRGQLERAAAEMEQIRQIADGAGNETRQVVQGRRGVDLASELQGARSVLESAGVSCAVVADTRWVQLPIAERLAWVTREAVTNILRHSKATTVRIELSSQDPIRLLIVNDNPLEGTTGTANGLLGMKARVAEVGGRLTSRVEGNSFELCAEIPTRPANDQFAVPIAQGAMHR